MEWLSDPEIWTALLTLTALEIVLGVDNIVFISILAGKLPPEQRKRARYVGLGLAMGGRLAAAGDDLDGSSSSTTRSSRLPARICPAAISSSSAAGSSSWPRAPSRFTRSSKGTRPSDDSRGPCLLRLRDRPDPPARHRLLAGLRHHRRRHGGRGRRHDRGGRHRRGRHARPGEHDQRLRRRAPDGEDPRAELPAAHRHVAGRREPRPAHPEGLHLLRDGVLGLRRVAQPAPAGEDGRSSPCICIRGYVSPTGVTYTPSPDTDNPM